jgi:SAM-dependent methyltransferase
MKFWNHAKDVEKERQRYNLAGAKELSNDTEFLGEGFLYFPNEHIAPFREYYTCIEKVIGNVKDVLEIGAGGGQHTRPIVRPYTRVIALDISEISLEVLQKKFDNRIKTVVGNIESLPFADASFDLIVSCGVLSYGDPSKVDHEILRTLRPGGTFIFIDSLNHNPIFKANRWARFLRGNRSLSTVLRIPTMPRLQNLSTSFQHADFSFFGTWIWLYPILKIFLKHDLFTKVINSLDNIKINDKYAFKVVGTLKGKKI